MCTTHPSRRGGARAQCGLILYPEALIDRTAYAHIATRLSESGVLVALVNLEPYRVVATLNGCPLREKAMRILSDAVLLSDQGTWTIDEWAVGGHSMGGHLAIATVANELSSTVKKVVLWGVISYPNPGLYPCKLTLREIGDVDVLAVDGSEDKIAKGALRRKGDVAAFQRGMPLEEGNLGTGRDGPGRKCHVTIEGGNHAGCAHYGPQTFPVKDGIRTVTLEQQQRRTAEATVDFLLDRPKSD